MDIFLEIQQFIIHGQYLSYINKPDREFMPYWVNTAENSIIKKLTC